MRKFLLVCTLLFTASLFAHATITCNFTLLQIDSNETAPIDVDGDGTNDFLLYAEYTSFGVNNYIVGVSGNEIEVQYGDRARRIESGDPVGSMSWASTAYMIKAGQGAFSGGEEEYGHVGVRLSKNGTYNYGFLEVRAPYWQAFVAVYSRGYNDVALAETRTDACPHPVGIGEEKVSSANAFLSGNLLHVSLTGEKTVNGSEVHLMNAAGQLVHRQLLQHTESDILLNGIGSGVYIVAILNKEHLLLRKKVVIL